jgi:type I restriction enzyme S subunit
MELRTTDSLCSLISSGGTPSRKRTDFYTDGLDGHLWVKSKELLDRSIEDTEEKITDEGLDSSSAKYFPADTVLIAMYGANVGQLGWLKRPATVNQAVCGLVVNKEIASSRFVFYAFLQTREALAAKAQGAAQQNLNQGLIREFRIPSPPLPTQQKIAAILSAYDDLIENNLRRIKILEEMAQNLYREWFVKFRFPGHKHARLTDSALGKIPEGWKVILLGSLIAEHIGGGWGKDVEDDKHTAPAWVIRGTDIPDARSCDFSRVPLRYHTKSNLKSRCLMPGDIVFEVSGGSKDQLLGRSLYISSELLTAFNGVPVICASFCKRIQSDSDKYASLLLYLSFLDAYVSGEIKQYQVQSTGISNYKWSDYLEKTSRCVPPIALQERFCELSVPMFSEIATLGRKNTILRRTRDLLLPKLISGEVDVSELDIAVTEDASA